MNKRRWLRNKNMWKQRIAAKFFSSASVIAGKLWSELPKAMRRLADGGAFNRLVGHCRMLIEEGDGVGIRGQRPSISDVEYYPNFGQLGDIEGLLNLNLSLDSTGPHRVSSSLSSSSSREYEGSESEEGFGRYGRSIRLVGLDTLFDELDAARVGDPSKSSKKYVVAQHFNPNDNVRRAKDWDKLGTCKGWAKAARNGSEERYQRPERRVRVWVHASSIVETEWYDTYSHYKRKSGTHSNAEGIVTDWLVLKDGPIASSYVIQGPGLTFPAASWANPSVYVVFTAVEVSEKRGRHWVRLPWACKMRVSDTVVVGEDVVGMDRACYEQRDEDARSWLVGVNERVVEGIGRREWDFSEWEQNFQDFQNWQDFLVDGLVGDHLVEFKVSLKDNGQRMRCPYEVAGGLVRAGP